MLRLERDTSGAVVWQMGGTEPMRDDRPAPSTPSTGATQYLPKWSAMTPQANEFCGQHHGDRHAGADSVLMFDNGNHCLRAAQGFDPRVTRIVEYDISSGTEARFVREYRLPDEYGYVKLAGGVMALANGHWLVGWGLERVGGTEEIAVSEVDTAGN